MEMDLFRDMLVLPRLLLPRNGLPPAGLERIRGVWGMALHRSDAEACREVFRGKWAAGKDRPAYALADGRTVGIAGRPGLVWTLIGRRAIAHDAALIAAWKAAGETGVSSGAPGAPRVPFRMRGYVLSPGFEVLPEEFAIVRGWPLSAARWPIDGDPARAPCRVVFPGGLHLRSNNTFIGQPTWADVVRAAYLRVHSWIEPEARDGLESLWSVCRADARDRHHEAQMTVSKTAPHYSGRQQTERTYLACYGEFHLPEGPGPSWPLLAAAQWLHIGRHTTEGMGVVRIEPLLHPSRRQGGRETRA